MIIIIRHSDDESDGCSQEHDCQLAKNGRFLAYKVGKKLIDEHGLPDQIYVSPFRRTIQTMKYMLYKTNTQNIEIIEDKRLSRYFTSKEKRNPIIDRTTRNKDIPIYESFNEFKERIADFNFDIIDNAADATDGNDKIIWIITHVVVYKRLYQYITNGKELKGHIPFMDHYSFDYCEDCDRYHKL